MQDLPAEVRCNIIETNSFTVRDVLSATKTSSDMYHDFHSCLKYLRTAPIKRINIGDDYFTEGGQDYDLTVDFILSYPNLVECEYPILIKSFIDIEKLAQHPKIQKVILDYRPLFDNVIEPKYNQDFGTSDYEEWEPYGTSVTFTKKTFRIRSITEAFTLFISRFRYHRSRRNPIEKIFDNVEFKFISPWDIITFRSGSLCVFPIVKEYYPEPYLHDTDEMASEINAFHQLIHYAGPFPPPEKRDQNDPEILWQDVTFYITGSSDITEYDEMNNLDINDRIIIPYLNKNKDILTRFALYSNNSYFDEVILNWNIIGSLENRNIVLSKMKIFDVPLFVWELPRLTKIMPNVRSPLIQANELIDEEDIELLKQLQTNFIELRIPSWYYDNFNKKVETEPFPKLPIPTRIDPNNHYSKFPCSETSFE